MLSRQNNFGYTAGGTVPPVHTVSFTSPNTAGNGLIVVAFWSCGKPCTSPNFTISDSAGNTYQSIGACGVFDGVNVTSLLQVWYVNACKAGSNAVSVTQTSLTSGILPNGDRYWATYFFAVSVFEYAGALGTVDASSFASGVKRPSMPLVVADTDSNDLLFAFAVELAFTPIVNLDSSSSGWTTEEAEATDNPVYAASLAVDQVVGAPGLQRILFDFGAGNGALDMALLVALPCGLSAPPPPPPSPSAPVLPAGQAWPTIF
jgi:hypothetical protein